MNTTELVITSLTKLVIPSYSEFRYIDEINKIHKNALKERTRKILKHKKVQNLISSKSKRSRTRKTLYQRKSKISLTIINKKLSRTKKNPKSKKNSEFLVKLG